MPPKYFVALRDSNVGDAFGNKKHKMFLIFLSKKLSMLSNTCLKENFMILSQLAIFLRKLFVSNGPWYSVIHGIEAKI